MYIDMVSDLVEQVDHVQHAHSQRTNSFLYGNVFSTDPVRCDRQLLLPTLLAPLSNDFSLSQTQFNTDSEKAGTGRRTMGTALDGNCLCYTMEVSFFSYRPGDEQQAAAVSYVQQDCTSPI